MSALPADTIVAIATPIGRGGIGVVRLSGENIQNYMQALVGKICKPRQAEFCHFYDIKKNTIDEGVAIYFKAPQSFTGEDVLELQAHGSPIVLDTIVETCLDLGARIARPGEFSERAFLNDKIDLAQAEAIADLIDASTKQAAQAALNSLQGEFSKLIDEMALKLINLRVFIEATIDFPDEEIDFINDYKILEQLITIKNRLQIILQNAQQGRLLRDGIQLIIAGRPNAGKSSLLNCLVGQDIAIVTDIAGTTRDILKEQIQIDGIPLHLIDTAGIRDSADVVEQEGIKRAKSAMLAADHLLWLIDATDLPVGDWFAELPTDILALIPKHKITFIINKIDLLTTEFLLPTKLQTATLLISASNKQGINELKQYLKSVVGYQERHEGIFTARRRHLNALIKANSAIEQAIEQLTTYKALELAAEELLQAHQCLAEITGKMTSDELLGEIFSTFCIGK